ncbi:MAG: SIMPL domain-containing protein [Nitrosopumilus sp.]|nr:SIMPL domain-containing protein [Nitrosopumilus sp.]
MEILKKLHNTTITTNYNNFTPIYALSAALFIYTILIIVAPPYLSPTIPSIYAQNIVFPDEKPTLSVVGEAEKEIPSDETKISLAVENTAANANTARKSNAEKMESIISVLKTNGLTNDNISTTNFEIRPNYDYVNENYDKIISYTALNKIILTSSANSNISSFIDLAVNNGANRVDNIEFITSKKVLNENFNELLKEAFTNAKQKADLVSIEGGFLLNGVKKIDINQNNGYNTPTYSFDAYSSGSVAEKAPAPSTQIIPQQNKLTVTLPIIFFIENQFQ